ncbi:MAG: hypothetical protein ACYDIA_07455 [Candidatus Humimicrobiaceae bacterium]
MKSIVKKYKPLLLGEFLHSIFWDNSINEVSLETDIDNDFNKERISLGIATQLGIQIEIHLKDNTFRLSEISGLSDDGDFREGFYCQLVIKDITRDGNSEILLAIGNGSSETYLNIWKFDRFTYLNTQRKKYLNPFQYLGCIEGQEHILIYPSGRIDVPFGSQGLFTSYIWDGLRLTEIENNEAMDDNLMSLEVGSTQFKPMKCFLLGTQLCNKDIRIKENWVFLAYDYGNKEIEKVIKSGIFPVLKEFKLESKVAKDLKVNYDFMCKICKLIQESKYFIADITGLNFNVGFELGIATGIGRDSIIIANKNAKEASDLKRSEAIRYNMENMEEFKSDFSDMLKNIIEKKI